MRIGPRGKYFTDVVRTEPVPVVIQLEGSRVYGDVHLHPEHRLLDQLNESAGFLAVTNVRLEEPAGPITSSFMAIRLDRIVWVVPEAEIDGPEVDNAA
jgi:hypothetical protein